MIDNLSYELCINSTDDHVIWNNLFPFYLKDLNLFKNPILNSLGLQELQFSRKYVLFRIDDLDVQPYSKNGLQGLISYL